MGLENRKFGKIQSRTCIFVDGHPKNTEIEKEKTKINISRHHGSGRHYENYIVRQTLNSPEQPSR